MAPCREAAEWIMTEMPRTEEGGIQHQTSDDWNEGEIWGRYPVHDGAFFGQHGPDPRQTERIIRRRRSISSCST